VGLERDPLSLVRIIEELLEWKSSGSVSRKPGIRCADHATPLYQLKLALTSPTGCGRSVGIVRLRTKTTEFSSFLVGKSASLEPAKTVVFSDTRFWCDMIAKCYQEILFLRKLF
jgi:hypothetical protein